MTDQAALAAIRARHVVSHHRAWDKRQREWVLPPSDKPDDCDTAQVLAALDAAEAREKELRAALEALVRVNDALIEAEAGRGHDGKHNEDLRFDPSAQPSQDDCSACASAEYGNGVELVEYALPAARAALRAEEERAAQDALDASLPDDDGLFRAEEGA